MTDTPEHIRQLQLNIWLSKSPMERLLQFLQDNEALFLFWKNNSLVNDSFIEPQANENPKT
ncbi:MAG TPA: hypothetical protein VGI61_05670 [Parafilimonas sp.]|jgi:hypothetical protein